MSIFLDGNPKIDSKASIVFADCREDLPFLVLDLEEAGIGEVASNDGDFLFVGFFFFFIDFFGDLIAFKIELVGEPRNTSRSPEPLAEFLWLATQLLECQKGIIPALSSPSAEFITAQTEPLANIFI
jgi:hypothetical protein